MEIKIRTIVEYAQYFTVLLAVLSSLLISDPMYILFAFLLLIPLFVYLKYDKLRLAGFALLMLVLAALLGIFRQDKLVNILVSCFYWLLFDALACLFADFILKKLHIKWEIKLPMHGKINIGPQKLSIVALVLISMIPVSMILYEHFSYPYPLHVDEWFHIGMARTIMNNNYNSSIDTWTGNEMLSPSFESGWHYALAAYGKITGDTFVAYLFLAALMSAAAVVSSYFFSKRWGMLTGFTAALLIAVLPTNIQIGGMSMLLPMNLFFIFMPLCLKIAFDFSAKWYPVLFSILLFLWFAHPPSAAITCIIIGFYALVCLFGRPLKGVYLLLTESLSFAIFMPFALSILDSTGKSIVFNSYLNFSGLPLMMGIIPTILFIVGAYFIIQETDKENISLLISAFFIIGVIVVFARTGVTWFIPIQRIYLPAMMLLSFIAALGLRSLLKMNLSNTFKGIIAMIFILGILFSVYGNLNTDYYKLVNNNEYQDMIWISENTPADAKFLVLPLKARPFYPITLRHVVSVMPFGPDSLLNDINTELNSFLGSGCSNTTILEKYRPDYIYYNGNCTDPMLIGLGHNLYNVTYR